MLGSLNLDRTTTVADLPGPGETVLARDLLVRPGAKGANQAVAAARAGATVEMIGRVGDDEPGKGSLAGLRAHGVDTGAVLTTEGVPTGQAFITVDEHGENSIVVVPGANELVSPDDIAQDVIAAAEVLVVQLEVPLETVCAAMRFAAAEGVRIVLNPSPIAELPFDVLALADPLVVNQHELAALPEGLASVCVTLGAEGARWRGASAAPPPVQVRDTTGAGDAFAGTLAAALATGRGEPEALADAVAASAEATSWPGAQPPVT